MIKLADTEIPASPYREFGRHFEDDRPITGNLGGSGGSQPANAQNSGAAGKPDDESPTAWELTVID